MNIWLCGSIINFTLCVCGGGGIFKLLKNSARGLEYYKDIFCFGVHVIYHMYCHLDYLGFYSFGQNWDVFVAHSVLVTV